MKVSVIEPGNYASDIGKNAAQRLGIDSRLADRSRFKPPDEVAAAAMHALFDANPKRRYMVVPNQGEAMLARIAPALLPLVLAPLTAEFLLGDFSIRQIALLFALERESLPGDRNGDGAHVFLDRTRPVPQRQHEPRHPTTVLDDVGQVGEVALVLALIAGAVWLRRSRSGLVQ